MRMSDRMKMKTRVRMSEVKDEIESERMKTSVKKE